MAIAPDTALVSHRLAHRLSQGDTDVLYRVVCIDVQVTPGADFKVNQAVARNLVKHVFEERHTGIEGALAGAVEVDGYADLRFQCIAFDSSLSL